MTGQPEFGSVLWQARCNAGLRLRDAADRLRVHPDYLRRLERGTERPPSNRLLTRLEKLYGLERDALYVAAGRLPPELYEMAATAQGMQLLRAFQELQRGDAPIPLSAQQRAENVRLSQQLERA
ncbi:helix-turn-helix domain-containing protein [Deinococcus sp. VB142]|uniref:Helix-turn-helix domain-containing protein n=1 Tax=Deinococcus sp. VB142 TaxID=3112952 RepID=A0AAU6Q448_9DEIO